MRVVHSSRFRTTDFQSVAFRLQHRDGQDVRRTWVVAARAVVYSFFVLIASVGFAGVVNAQEPMEVFLTKHCVGCHGPDNEEGELRIDQLSRDFNSGVDTQRWAEVIERINAGEMPPEDEPQPTQEEISAFVTKLDTRIKEGKAARMAARPDSAGRTERGHVMAWLRTHRFGAVAFVISCRAVLPRCGTGGRAGVSC